VAEIAKLNTAFSWDLFTKLAAKNVDGNVFFSPYSISTALAMTLVGAKNNTATQMKSVLKFSDLADGDINKNFAALQSVINAPDVPYSLNTANRIFANRNNNFLHSFLNETKKSYKAAAENLDFADAEGSRKRINNWVEGQTANKIKDLLPVNFINAGSAIVLVNAIYFKANWEHTFHVFGTLKSPFWLTADQSVDVDMMHMTRDFKLAKRDDLACRILQLPYVKGNKKCTM
jgi:serine protease inhibitor